MDKTYEIVKFEYLNGNIQYKIKNGDRFLQKLGTVGFSDRIFNNIEDAEAFILKELEYLRSQVLVNTEPVKSYSITKCGEIKIGNV